MKQFTGFALGALIFCSLIAEAFGQAVAENDLQKFARKFIPEGAELAHQTVRGRFAESAATDASGNIVVLYQKDSGVGGYEGLVVVPKGSEYDRYKLPEPESTWSMMDPVAVFFANADGDAENELLIIEKCYTGIGPTGARPFYRTRVYDWNGNGFVHMESLSEKIGNGNTVVKVRNNLRRIAKTSKSEPTEMFQAVEFGPYNEKIEKAAAAGEGWVKMPTQIVARMIGEFSEMRSRTIEMTAPTADEPNLLTVTVTNDGYLDDSVRGEKFRYELRATEQGVWRFTSAAKAWRCWPGRGNQNFSTTKCS